MIDLNIKFDAVGAAELLDLELADVADQLLNMDMSAPLKEIAEKPLAQQIRRSFDLEVGPDGTAWEPWHFRAPWSPEEHPTLYVSGALFESYLPGGAHHIQEIGPKEMEYGSDLPYAEIHQNGATFTLGIPLIGRDGGGIAAGTQITIPARPVMGWAEETVAEAEMIIAIHTVQTLSKKGAA